MKVNIKDLSIEELNNYLKRNNLPLFHSRQILRWVYQRGATLFSSMTDLNKPLRDLFSKEFDIAQIKLHRKQLSKDGTIKYAFQLSDNQIIESVLIPARGRNTICLSSQAGCKFNCTFCSSAKSGFSRNLLVSEIMGQFLQVEKDRSKKITHIVFMGVGEPLDNYDNVLKSIRIFNNQEFGLGIGARRITISTCGIIPGIRKLAKEGMQFELSVSLHSALEEIRTKLMPVNKKYPLKELIPALKDYSKKTKRQITFEYVMIRGVNIDQVHAEALSKIMKGFDYKVNLIAFNARADDKRLSPKTSEINKFKIYLEEKRVLFTQRVSRGQDIEAACGQLRARLSKRSADA